MSDIRDDVLDHISINSRKGISGELFQKLRKAILNGTLPGSYAFPNENELCKKFDVGRSTLREALKSLETLQLITRTKTGTYVNEKKDIHNSMNFDIIAQYTDPINVIEYRRIMEVGMARLAAVKANEADIAKLSSIVDDMEQHGAETGLLTRLDFAYHSKIAKMTGNELLVISFNTIRSVYEKFVKERFEKDLFSQSIADHRALIEAFKLNDVEKAASLMMEHLTHIEKTAVAATAKTQ